MIPFSRREMTRAWTTASQAAQVTPRTNAHRLLLFYAVECGLKASYMKRCNMDPIGNHPPELITHDLNRILALLHVGGHLSLPSQMRLPSFKNPLLQRSCNVGEINQVWRYGGSLEDPTDFALEQGLEAIQHWISKELQ